MPKWILGPLPDDLPAVLGCDLETSGLDPYTNKLLSVSFSDGEQTWIVLDTHGFDSVRNVLTDPAATKLFHNAKFDMAWLKHCLGVDVVNYYCTFLAENIIQGGKGLPASLADVVARRVGAWLDKGVREEFIDHPGFKERPVTTEQLQYMRDDVIYLPSTYRQQMYDLSEADLLSTLGLELDVLPATVALELGGQAFDKELWDKQLKTFQFLMQEADEQLRALIGDGFVLTVDRVKKGEPVQEEIPVENINFNSPSQLKTLLHQRFGLALNSTRAELLADVRDGRFVLASKTDKAVREACAYVLTIRRWQKRIGFDYPQFIHPVTGRIHPNYWQLGARTGRFSCSKPNMQQVPRPVKGEPNMRHLFTSDSEEFVIIRADYSQQEPRILAQLSGDRAMIKACNTEDVYIEFGTLMFGRPIEKGSEERFLAKTFVLAVGYAAGIARLAAASGLSEAKCREIKRIIQRAFPTMVGYASRMERQAQMYGFVTTALGRRRYFAPGKVRFTETVNTPVQGTAADMFKLALARIHLWLTEQVSCGKIHANTRVWNIVHDEIEVHCHVNDREFVQQNVCSIMEEAGTDLCPDVKHIAEAEYGRTWDK